jgi:D-3-phosphoglycerate dehydrogenase
LPARQIVSEPDVVASLDAGQLRAYVCDFPSRAAQGSPRVVTLPHLGASTGEAEENCAVMAAEGLRDFLENGNIRNSVNFPESSCRARRARPHRHCQQQRAEHGGPDLHLRLASAGINIADLLNKSRGEYAYTLIDTDGDVSPGLIGQIQRIEGVLSARIVRTSL